MIYWDKNGVIFPAVKPDGSLHVFALVEGADELAQAIESDTGQECRTITISGVTE